jgi:hypothetical protein
MKITTLSDPTQFAQAIRSLAQDAHWTLRNSPSPADLRKLSRRIERLSSELGDRSGAPLETWLDSLGQEVKSAAIHRAASSRPMCICA